MSKVRIECRKKGNVLLEGDLVSQDQFGITVMKTYPNGSKGGVTYLPSDVKVNQIEPEQAPPSSYRSRG